MPLNFPNSPSIGATYSPAGVSKSWIYTGEQWSAITAPIEEGASVTVSDTPPSGASAGDLWFDSSSGVTSVYYDSSWIDVGGGDSGTSAGSVNGIVQCDGNGNFSAADLETLINNIIMEPTSSAVFNGTQTNTVLTNQPAILYSANMSQNSSANGPQRGEIKSGSTTVLFLYAHYAVTNDNPTFPIGGIDCPNGINVTVENSSRLSITYKLK